MQNRKARRKILRRKIVYRNLKYAGQKGGKSMKRKYFVTAIAVILCMVALGTAVYALAAGKASGGGTGRGKPFGRAGGGRPPGGKDIPK